MYFKSAISPLLELQIRWFFFWNCIFLKYKFIYATFLSWICMESLLMDGKVASQFCPFFFQKKIPTCAKESALIPDVENLLQWTIKMHDITEILEHKRDFIDRGPLRGGNLLIYLYTKSNLNNYYPPWMWDNAHNN